MATATTQPRALEHNILDLSEAIYASEMLLTYCSQSGIDLEPEVLAILVQAHHTEATQRDAAFETRFWGAFNEAMRRVAPVTIESLAASLGTFDFSGNKAKQSKPRIPAQRAVVRYRWTALAVLMVLIAVQGYMDWGRITQTQMRDQQREQLELEKRMVEFVSSSEHPDSLAAMSNPVYERMVNERNAIEAGFSNNHGKLESWCFWRSLDHEPKLNPYREYVISEERNLATAKLEDPASNDDERTSINAALAAIERQEERARATQGVSDLLVTSGLILTLLQAYALPLLYGLLGASLHVLRSLQDQIKSVTYSPASELEFRIHLALGSLAGMSVGWLLVPGTTDTTPLSGFAVAFLAGYSVEFLFLVIDRLIAKATASTRNATETAKPARATRTT